MARLSEDDFKAKKDKFIESYLKTGNQSEAARIAGYSPKGAHKRGYELMQDDYVKEKIGRYQEIQKNNSTDSIGTLDDIFESIGPTALRAMQNKQRLILTWRGSS